MTFLFRIRFSSRYQPLIGTLFAFVSGLFLTSELLAQTNPPKVEFTKSFEHIRDLEEKLYVGPPDAPILISPHDGAIRNPGLNNPDFLTFYWGINWKLSGNPHSYLFHLCRREPNGEVCDSDVSLPSLPRNYSPPGGLPAMVYQGRTMTWSVSGCRRVTFKAKDACARSEERTFSWPLPAPAWIDPFPVITKSSGKDIIATLWTNVYGADAGYLICIGTSVANCPSVATGHLESGDPYVFFENSVGREIEVERLPAGFHGKKVKIKLAACTRADSSTPKCTYQAGWIELSLPTP